MRYLFLLFSIITFSQQTKYVDFLTCNAILYPNFEEKSITGFVQLDFKVLSSIDSIKIDAKQMNFTGVQINGKEVKYLNTSKQLVLFEGFKKGKNTLQFNYKAIPKQTLYFIGDVNDYQIWTQGQGKYTSHWLPSFDDVNEKVVFGITIKYYVNMDKFQFDPIALSNGKLNFEKNTISWSRGVNDITRNYQMQKPMSSYLVMLTIGNFAKQATRSKSGTPLEFYVCQSDFSKLEPTYRYSKQIFDYLEQEIGVKYPWKIYRQVPVRDFLYAGMENTTSTIFAQDFVVDSIGFNDRNYCNVNAHELAHQWFGDLVTAQSGKHHWLQEGFATYYALLAERHIFGDDYFYHELYEYATQLKSASATDTIPILSEKASALSYYKKGAWALHVLREDIGSKKFQKAVKRYLKKHQFKNATTEDFLAEIHKIAPLYNVDDFRKKWLESADFDMEVATVYLKKNNALATLLELSKKKVDMRYYTSILQSNVYFPVKQWVFYKLATTPFKDKKELIDLGLNQGWEVRQAIIETTETIPLTHKEIIETLLEDPSYRTKEMALFRLCNSFPEAQQKYLKQTAKMIGLNDKSFRTTWLQLAYRSNGYKASERDVFFKELLAYADVTNESSVRQNALEVLVRLAPNDERVIELLFKATVHHKWQFTLFARTKIRALLQDETYRQKVAQLAENASLAMQTLYLKFLNENN
nr:M1 family metallopeptidase [uncultured Flavobacterium sp.]